MYLFLIPPPFPLSPPFSLPQLHSEAIMHECIQRLLRSTSDGDSLECCAVLMTTVGKVMDHSKGKVWWQRKIKCAWNSISNSSTLCLVVPNGQVLQQSVPHHWSEEDWHTSTIYVDGPGRLETGEWSSCITAMSLPLVVNRWSRFATLQLDILILYMT